MEELVQATVEEHDRYQLEFKFDYTLLDERSTNYKIVTYLFFPRSFGVNQYTYAASDFYHSLQNYVRLKTPSFSLGDIRVSPTSPLLRLRRLLAEPDWVRQPDSTERLISNFKFLRAILKVSLDEEADSIRALIAELDSSTQSVEYLCSKIDFMLTETGTILDAYRDIGPQLGRRNVDARVLRSFRLTDEALSLVVEDVLLATLYLLQKGKPQGTDFPCASRLVRAIRRERFYRKSRHYLSVLEPNSDVGEFLFRVSVLKKFTSSVLYLSTSVQREGETVEQILYALAAGISMIFATIVAFYAQRRYGNFTFPLFVALVIGYMFKDRIKDAMRALSNRALRSALYDRRTRIRTLDGAQQVGYLRERILFVSEDAVPAAVMRARNRQSITELDNDGQGEEVLRYEKRVKLRRAAVRQLYIDAPEVGAIKDVMRLDVRDYLRKMDDPTQTQLYLKGNRVRRARLPRVYFFNIVQVYYGADSKEPIHTSRIRVTLTRKGIRRVTIFD